MENLTYLDFLVLVKIDQNSVIERFGPAINTSFFEAANLLGTLKVKGFVDLETSIGGMSRISLTEYGRDAIDFCNKGTLEPLDALDNAILEGVGRGYVALDRLTDLLNVKPSDLAVHLNKLAVQAFLEPSIKSAKVTLVLTEKGFNAAGKSKSPEGFASPGQTKLTDEVHAKQAAQEKAMAEAHKEEPKPAVAKPAPSMHDPMDIAQDAKDILFGFMPKPAPAAPKPAPEKKQQAAAAAPAGATADSALSGAGVKGEIKPEQAPIPEKAQVPAYPYTPQMGHEEQAAESDSKPAGAAKPAAPLHHASKAEIKNARLFSKLEYYLSESISSLIVLLALLAGVAIVYFLFILMGFKIF